MTDLETKICEVWLRTAQTQGNRDTIATECGLTRGQLNHHVRDMRLRDKMHFANLSEAAQRKINADRDLKRGETTGGAK